VRGIVKEVEVESIIRVAIDITIGLYAMELSLYQAFFYFYILFSRPFSSSLCLSHFPPLALFGISVLIPVLPSWPVAEAYPRDL